MPVSSTDLMLALLAMDVGCELAAVSSVVAPQLPQLFNSTVTGLSLSLILKTTVLDRLSVAFRPNAVCSAQCE